MEAIDAFRCALIYAFAWWRCGGDVVAIIYAKWQVFDPKALYGKLGIQQTDMYQLHAYSYAYECPRVALWYPSPSLAGGFFGKAVFQVCTIKLHRIN